MSDAAVSSQNTSTPAAPASAPAPKTAPAKTAAPAAAPSPEKATPKQFMERVRARHVGTDPGFEADFSEPVDEPDPVVPDEPEGADLAPVQEPDEAPEESDEEPEAEDYSWAEQLKAYKEGLHNIPLADLLQALSEGRLPENLYKVLKVKLKDGENEWEETIDMARNGAMMRKDYQKKTQKLADERDAFFGERNEFVTMLQNWKSDPKALKAGLSRMGFPFLDAAKLLAEEHRTLAGMDPIARQLFDEKQKIEEELAQFKYEQQKQSKQTKAAEEKATTQKRIDFVSDTGAKMFQSMGIPMNKGTWGVFLRYFETETRGNPGVAWSEDMVRSAVETTFEDYNALKAEIGGGAAAAPKPKAFAGAAAAGSSSSPARAQAQKAGVLAGAKLDSGSTPKPKPRAGGKMTRDQWMAEFKKR